jgi:2-succinyl-6-hydroxy-2,4-cyclohexadiene-1-carboxylate synthase
MLDYLLDGAGPPVTLLHGFTQSANSWDELISLMPAGHRWIRPDLPGHGHSAMTGTPTLESTAEQLIELWDALGVERTHLVGYSLGGRVALYTAARHHDRLLTLTAISAHAGFEGNGRESRRLEDVLLADRIERDGVDWFASYWALRPIFAGLARRGPDFLTRLDAARRANSAAGLTASLRGMGGAAAQPFWEEIAAITVPALFIAGAEDQRYVKYARRLAALAPAGRAAVVPRSGHVVHLEQPEAIAGLLAAQLSVR